MKKLTRIQVSCAAIALSLAVAGPAVADGMQVQPGKWEFKATSVMPMMPAPNATVETQCVTESEVQPEMFLEYVEGCTLRESETDAASMRWKVTCATSGGRVDGEGSARSTGTTVRGAMTLLMNFSGQQMTMRHDWEGRRVGPCD